MKTDYPEKSKRSMLMEQFNWRKYRPAMCDILASLIEDSRRHPAQRIQVAEMLSVNLDSQRTFGILSER
jgi:hypothetical protein